MRFVSTNLSGRYRLNRRLLKLHMNRFCNSTATVRCGYVRCTPNNRIRKKQHNNYFKHAILPVCLSVVQFQIGVSL
jgi:hypothetical protein